ncbi:MAG: hypothetical protein V2L15_05035, partial [Desulfobacteraceae bacterium]|nr:hypothetical protein [Desulfobacteraceae bacterium]
KGGPMYRYLLIPMAGMLLFLTSCVATVGPHGTYVSVAPPLPMVVELASPYYVHSGYNYYYHGKNWYYAPAKGKRWVALPKKHYPREVRFRNERSDRSRYQKHYRHDERYR